jgi:hypothetical protein
MWSAAQSAVCIAQLLEHDMPAFPITCVYDAPHYSGNERCLFISRRAKTIQVGRDPPLRCDSLFSKCSRLLG